MTKQDENKKDKDKKKREFHILIDQKPYVWEESIITGSQIKSLAGVDPSFGVWMEIPGPEDPPVADDQEVSLKDPGVERFFTGKKETREGKV